MGMAYSVQIFLKNAQHVVNFKICNPQFKPCKINICNILDFWRRNYRLWKLALPKLKTVIVINLADCLEVSFVRTEPHGQMINANCVHVW